MLTEILTQVSGLVTPPLQREMKRKGGNRRPSAPGDGQEGTGTLLKRAWRGPISPLHLHSPPHGVGRGNSCRQLACGNWRSGAREAKPASAGSGGKTGQGNGAWKHGRSKGHVGQGHAQGPPPAPAVPRVPIIPIRGYHRFERDSPHMECSARQSVLAGKRHQVLPSKAKTPCDYLS